MRLKNVLRLGVKELWSLFRDPMLIFLIIFAFTVSIYSASTAVPETLQNAPIAIVDEDRSPLSARIAGAFLPPYFTRPQLIDHEEMDARMDSGLDTFALNIPPEFQKDVLAGKSPVIQFNVDATRMSQAFTGSAYVQTIVNDEVQEFVNRYHEDTRPPVDLALRSRFNPTLDKSWFGAIYNVINNITTLSIVLTGAALLREREHGTIEHLLVMPVTPLEIMMAKVWSMALIVLVASAFSVAFVVQGLIGVPIEGSLALFFVGAAIHLFATTSMGIFFATIANSMQQFGLLLMLIVSPMQMLSGGSTPRESMPEIVQDVMLGAPTTHFITLSQAILFRGAGLDVVWPQLLALVIIGGVFFGIAQARLRNTIGMMS